MVQALMFPVVFSGLKYTNKSSAGVWLTICANEGLLKRYAFIVEDTINAYLVMSLDKKEGQIERLEKT